MCCHSAQGAVIGGEQGRRQLRLDRAAILIGASSMIQFYLTENAMQSCGLFVSRTVDFSFNRRCSSSMHDTQISMFET